MTSRELPELIAIDDRRGLDLARRPLRTGEHARCEHLAAHRVKNGEVFSWRQVGPCSAHSQQQRRYREQIDSVPHGKALCYRAGNAEAGETAGTRAADDPSDLTALHPSLLQAFSDGRHE